MANELPQEYLDYLKRNLNVVEALGDKLTGTDERVDYLVAQLATLNKQLSPETIASLARLPELVEELKEAGITMPTRTEQIQLSQTLLPQQGVRLTDTVPIDGKMTSVTLHFPPGCAAAVQVAFGYKTRQIIPFEGFIALDNATPVFPVSELVERNEELWCVMRNGDPINPHTPSVIVTIQGS